MNDHNASSEAQSAPFQMSDPSLLQASPPISPYHQTPGFIIWRDGKMLITPVRCTLPDACIKCNAPATKFKKKTYAWHSTWLYLLILVGLLVYLIVAIVVRKRATVTIGLCKRHARLRAIHLAVAWLLALGSVTLFVLAFALDRAELLLGLLGFIIAPAYGIIFAAMLAPKRIDGNYAWFKGCCGAFLDRFPVAERAARR